MHSRPIAVSSATTAGAAWRPPLVPSAMMNVRSVLRRCRRVVVAALAAGLCGACGADLFSSPARADQIPALPGHHAAAQPGGLPGHLMFVPAPAAGAADQHDHPGGGFVRIAGPEYSGSTTPTFTVEAWRDNDGRPVPG